MKKPKTIIALLVLLGGTLAQAAVVNDTLVTAARERIPVTAMEFEMLRVFAERPNRPLSRDRLLNLTQHRDWDPYDRSVDIRIARLRRKIEPDPDKPVHLKTVRGVGYMFVPDP